MKIFLLIASVLFFYKTASSQDINIIPKPESLVVDSGFFKINKQDVFNYSQDGINKSVDFFNGYLQQFYGFQMMAKKSSVTGEASIYLSYDHQNNLPEGYYKLNVTKSKISIKANDEEGVFYAMQTLIQLLPTSVSASLSIPCVTIIDSPRFAYRGLHLDCGRHFFNVDFIKKYIDFIALHKMNYFHWHLTEDQGWRIEIKKYPLLTSVGGCRDATVIGFANEQDTVNDHTKYCGYYTQEQIKDVVKYAADRYITIIPEIEMPGHATAAITAYPQLSCFPNEPKKVIETWGVFPDVLCPSDYTFHFMENVLDEVMELFPSKYIHIGGDECPKGYWKRSAFCQQLMKDSGIKNEDALESYFIKKIERYLNSKGHAIIGWDEILEGGVAPNATIMSWRGEEGGITAAKQHHQVMMTPGDYAYFDHSQNAVNDSLTIGDTLPVKKVYDYDPRSHKFTTEEASYVLGAQANVWTEYMPSPNKVEYMIFPRLSALSEVLWTQPANKNWDDFLKRLPAQYKRYDLWKVKYNKKLD